MRVLMIVALAVLSRCSPAAPPRASTQAVARAPASAKSWQELRREARAAREAKDLTRYRAVLLELFARSGSATLIYELAEIEARLDHRDQALERLGQYAAIGLIEGDPPSPALAPLRDDPRFPAIADLLRRNREPVAHATLTFDLPHADLVTEDIAYDEATRTFYVSSVHDRKILAIDDRGVARDFVANDPELASACGLALHAGRLWVASATLPPMIGYVESRPHPTALLAYDVKTGARVTKVDLVAEGEHALTDLTVGPAGDVFVSDALGGDVYVLHPGARVLERLCAEGTFVSPQTPAIADDGRVLFVPDYVRGLAKVDLATRAVSWLGHPPTVALNGIDGVYLTGHTFYAVQNGTAPPRIVRLDLDASRTSITRADVLEQRTEGLGEPTHGVFAGGAFYFLANAGWDRFDDGGKVRSDAPPDVPRVMRLALVQSSAPPAPSAGRSR